MKLSKLIDSELAIIRHTGVRSYLKYRLAPRGTVCKVTVTGVKLLVRKGSPDLRVAMTSLLGEFDILKFLLPSDYDGIIIDAGGYIGTATIAIKRHFPQARIVVVEPSEENIKILEKNLSGMSNVEVIHGAIVGSQRETTYLRNRGTGAWGFTVVSDPSDNADSEVLHSTTTYRLSDLAPDLEQVGLIKLDIEGGEVDLLDNDSESLSKIRVVFAELHERIVPDCERKFFEFSEKRILVKDQGEKYLSIRKE